MSRWLSIEVLSDIADNGLDFDDRQKFGFNLIVTCVNPTEFEDEVGRVLIDAGATTSFGTDMFAMSKSNIPTGDGPYVSIVATGGPKPMRTHNADRDESAPAYRRLTVQVVARAKNSKTARAKAHACFDALFAIVNQTITA